MLADLHGSGHAGGRSSCKGRSREAEELANLNIGRFA
jgi:hypothetical protein